MSDFHYRLGMSKTCSTSAALMSATKVSVSGSIGSALTSHGVVSETGLEVIDPGD